MPKKPTPKPLFPLKHEFVDSLENYINKASSLAQAIGMLLRSGDIKGPIAEILQERLDEFNAARSSE